MKHCLSLRALATAAVACFAGAAAAQTTPTINHVKANQLNYRQEISVDDAADAFDAVQNDCSTALGALYTMVGGKDGNPPAEHAYQYCFATTTDCYVQYSCVTHSDFQYSSDPTLASTYGLNSSFSGGPGGQMTSLLAGVSPLLNSTKFDKLPEIKAIYLLFFDYASVTTADFYGALPYFDYKNNKSASPYTYNDVRTVYYNVIDDIDSIISCLDYYKDNRDADYQDLIGNTIYGSIAPFSNTQSSWTTDGIVDNFDFYKRFANALKLRMAINFSEVEPEVAQQWAEEAVASGLPQDKNDQVGCFSDLVATHPLSAIWVGASGAWQDNVIGASFASILLSLNHPWVKDGNYIFAYNQLAIPKTGSQGSAPTTTKAKTGIIGMRDGTTPGVGQGNDNPYNCMTGFNSAIFRDTQAPIYYMKYSEVLFNLAEAALRGWNVGGTAQHFYEEGIRNAQIEDPFKTDNLLWNSRNYRLSDYMNQTKPVDYTYVDPTGNTPDMPSVTKIGVKWDDSESDEVKLEKIITQKYIAAFPNSYQPFNDMRRTGYPKVFPVLNVTDGDGSLKEGEQLRRLTWYHVTDRTALADIANSGLAALGGPDKQATRVYWDVRPDNGSNFITAGINTIDGKKTGFVQTDNALSFENVDRAYIYDTTGKLVVELAQPRSLNTANLAPGLYIVKVVGQGHEQVEKIVVK